MAELCYATWQGLEALVAHFRKSAVMSQHLFATPKLFYTELDGPSQCGLLRKFPGPDNEFKLAQSKMNIGNIGMSHFV